MNKQRTIQANFEHLSIFYAHADEVLLIFPIKLQIILSIAF